MSPRLSEFAILCTARLWRAQYEWFAHEPQAERAGVKPATIRDLHAGRVPKSAPKDERAIYDFIHELYKTRRVSDKSYKRVQAVLGDAATVELVGILGYYVLVAMILNIYRMMPPGGRAAAVPGEVALGAALIPRRLSDCAPVGNQILPRMNSTRTRCRMLRQRAANWPPSPENGQCWCNIGWHVVCWRW